MVWELSVEIHLGVSSTMPSKGLLRGIFASGVFLLPFLLQLQCVLGGGKTQSGLSPERSAEHTQRQPYEHFLDVNLDSDHGQPQGENAQTNPSRTSRLPPDTEPVPQFLVDLYTERVKGNATASLGVEDSINQVRSAPFHGMEPYAHCAMARIFSVCDVIHVCFTFQPLWQLLMLVFRINLYRSTFSPECAQRVQAVLFASGGE